MPLWRELRRRNVFRVGIAYLAGAWLLLQVASIILPSFDASPWFIRAVIFALVVGFPIAVVLAWLYEWTPEGVKADSGQGAAQAVPFTGRKIDFVVIGILVVAIVVLVFDDHIYDDSPDGAPVELNSIAVLAFENLSSDPEDSYFSDGLANELLSVLARVQELKVAPRTSSFYFRGKDVDVTTIATTLGVAAVLSGTVQRDGDRIRVAAALDGASDGILLWSDSYDRAIDNLLDIQSEIARSVASAIVPVLSPESQALIATRPTANSAAYDYYLRGRDYLRLPAEITTIDSAEELFSRAISLDTRFGSAYAGRCETLLARYELTRTQESFQSAEVACHRALTLDDGSWEVRKALADLYRISGQFDKAILELETGQSLQPNVADLPLALGQTYAAQNNAELAEAALLRAEEIQSSDWRVHNQLGHLYWDNNRYDEALERYGKVIELTPDSGVGYDNLGNTYLSMGRFAEAEMAFNDSPLPSRWTYENRGLVYYSLGDFDRAIADHRRALEIAPENYTEWGNLGDAYRFVPGRERDARQAYERAIELAEQELLINPDDLGAVTRLSTYYVFTGQTDRAETMVQRFIDQQTDSDGYFFEVGHFFAARTMMHLGEMDLAYDYLRRTLDSGWTRAYLLSDPDLVALGGDERFARL